MGIIPTEIMKNDRDLELFWANPQLQITVLMCRSPVLSSNMAMIPDSDISLLIPCILMSTNMIHLSNLKLLFFHISHLQRLIQFGTYYFLAVLYF